MKKKDLYRLAKQVRDKLLLDDLDIDIVIADNKRAYLTKDGISERPSDCIAQVTNADSKKKKFTITFHKNSITSEVKDTIYHEMFHIMLWDTMGMLDEIIRLLPYDQKSIEEIEQLLYDREHDLIEKLMKLIK